MSDPGVERSLILTRLIFYVVFHRVSVLSLGQSRSCRFIIAVQPALISDCLEEVWWSFIQ
jgi:hypothetical protein